MLILPEILDLETYVRTLRSTSLEKGHPRNKCHCLLLLSSFWSLNFVFHHFVLASVPHLFIFDFLSHLPFVQGAEGQII